MYSMYSMHMILIDLGKEKSPRNFTSETLPFQTIRGLKAICDRIFIYRLEAFRNFKSSPYLLAMQRNQTLGFGTKDARVPFLFHSVPSWDKHEGSTGGTRE